GRRHGRDGLLSQPLSFGCNKPPVRGKPRAGGFRLRRRMGLAAWSGRHGICDAVAGALRRTAVRSKPVLQPWSARDRSEAVAAPRILVTPRPGTHTEPDAASTDRPRLRGQARTADA